MKNCCQTKCKISSVAIGDELGRRTEMTRSGSMLVATGADSCGYNDRDELVSAATGATAQYAYQYDDIGNRLTSFDLGTNRTYTANELNQYTSIAEGGQTFAPLFDLDGNQTNVLTSTGIWSVTYNGENRPVVWTCGTTNITMKFDRMGRRVEYIETDGATTNKHWKFVYDGYLCLQRLNGATNAITDLFEWDPTEPVATRPLYWQTRDGAAKHYFYLHDGNKNVANVVSYQRATGVVASYDYAPFGALIVSHGASSAANPWRFSSEYSSDTLSLVYYNFRQYSSDHGLWLSREPLREEMAFYLYTKSLGINRRKIEGIDSLAYYGSDYLFGNNRPVLEFDVTGMFPHGSYPEWGGKNPWPPYNEIKTKGNCWRYACNDPAKVGEEPRVNPPGTPDSPIALECGSIMKEVVAVSGAKPLLGGGGQCEKCHYKVIFLINYVPCCRG